MTPAVVLSQYGGGVLASIKSMVTSLLSRFEARDSTPNLSTLPDMLTWAAKTYGSGSLTFVTSPTAAEAKDLAWLESSVRTMAYSFLTAFSSSIIGAPSTGKKPIVIIYLSSHQDNMLAVWSALYSGFVPCLLPNLTAQLGHRKAHVEHLNSLLTSDSVEPIWLTHQIGSGQLNEAGTTGLNIKSFGDIKKATETQECPKDFNFTPADPDSEAILFLTSGSTGFSKAVVHTHRTILSACASKAKTYKLTPKSTTMNWVALDHVAGSIEIHFNSLMSGCNQVHVDAATILSDSTTFLRLIDDYKVSVTFAPNFLISKLANDISAKASELKGSFDISSLRRISSGGEAVVTSTVKAFCEALNAVRAPSHGDLTIEMAAGFGMTETCAGSVFGSIPCSLSNPGANLPSSKFLPLGRALLNVEMRIVSPEDGRTILRDAESGELQLRGPMLFVRYYNNPTATEQSFVEGGWFRTGDLGIIQHGELRLSGRIKDTIVVHGVTYGIPELETHLQGKEARGLIADSHLVVAPSRDANQDTETFVVFYAPDFDFYHSDNTTKESDLQATALLQKAHSHIKNVCVKMVTHAPFQIIPIPKEQLTKEKSTLGKFSRSRLVKQYSEGVFDQHLDRADALLGLGRSEMFVNAAAGSIAEKICKIFEGIFILEAGSVSAEDNFFEMGGTSIDIIRFKREVEMTMELPDEIPILRILLHPTPNLLSTLVDQILDPSASDTNIYDPVVPLQTTGDKTPIFFVHPGVGEVLIFVNLAKCFHGERPFYAFRARGFDAGQSVFTSIPEMVGLYANAMQRVQPHGPYAIAGYSYGGVIAYEVAKVIESRGEEVKFVGIVNIPPHIAYRMHEIDYTAGMLNLSCFLGLVTKQDAEDLAEPLSRLPGEEQVRKVFNLAPPQRLHELQLSIPKFNHWVSVTGSLIGCGKSYLPSGSVEVLDVFYAIPLKGTKADWLNKQLKPWQGFCRRDMEGREGGCTFTEVPGEHYTLMDSDRVPLFQKILRERLEARGV